ncbi:MAG: prepilin-type N-terminal cleavage/methylation domain-containing protein [Candidatus Omnitrophica bacterium]|nr:prepilin-type N-terminal cleavage/methylation domain-containing protein [Candidatus Omnitrophota bacterium]
MRQRIWQTRIKGFTLLELLITTSLIALMGLAIYSTFARGVMVWDRGGKTNIVEREVKFTLQSLAKELRSSFKFSGIEFKGTKNEISFPTYVNTAGIAEAPKWEVGRVSYFFDSEKNTFSRWQKNYIDLFQPEKPEAEKVIPQIKDLDIRYYYFDAIGKAYKWKDSWSGKQDFPLGVRIELTTLSDEKEQKFVKTVYLP